MPVNKIIGGAFMDSSGNPLSNGRLEFELKGLPGLGVVPGNIEAVTPLSPRQLRRCGRTLWNRHVSQWRFHRRRGRGTNEHVRDRSNRQRVCVATNRRVC